jgi:long-chain fatty acid transport protein
MRKLILALAAVLPSAALAGGYIVPNTNARDLAMSGSVMAAQDSAAATSANPAALSKLDGLNVSFGLGLIDFRSTWTDSGGVVPQSGSPGSVSMIPKGAFPPAIYAAYGYKLPNGMRLGVGAGFNVPGGGYVFWPGNWPGRFEIVTVDRKIYGMYLTGGIQVLPQVRVGGGLVYYRTTEHLIQNFNFLGTEGQAELGTAGGAVSFDLSAEVQPLKGVPLTIGADYKHQGVQSLTGKAHFESVPDALRGYGLIDQGVTHVLTYPNRFELGLAYRVIPPLLLTAGWTWERFHVYKNDVFSGDKGTTVAVDRDYKNGYTLRLGGEFQALPQLKVRAGVLHDTSPSRQETLSPTLPDADVWAGSLGAGYQITPAFGVDVAYFHAFYDTVSAAGPGAFPGTYDTRANIFSFALTWKMDAQGKK